MVCQSAGIPSGAGCGCCELFAVCGQPSYHRGQMERTRRLGAYPASATLIPRPRFRSYNYQSPQSTLFDLPGPIEIITKLNTRFIFLLIYIKVATDRVLRRESRGNCSLLNFRTWDTKCVLKTITFKLRRRLPDAERGPSLPGRCP